MILNKCKLLILPVFCTDFWPVSHIQPMRQRSPCKEEEDYTFQFHENQLLGNRRMIQASASEELRGAQTFCALCGRSCTAQQLTQTPAGSRVLAYRSFSCSPGMLWDVEDAGVTTVVDWTRQRTQKKTENQVPDTSLLPSSLLCCLNHRAFFC